MKTAGIAGAGLMGRILALELLKQRWSVSVFDQDNGHGEQSCGLTAGGMLSLYSEAEKMDDLVFALGCRSMELWPRILSDLEGDTHFQVLGSIVVAHASDVPDLERLCLAIKRKFPNTSGILEVLDDVGTLEEGLSLSRGVYLPREGNIDNVQLFSNLKSTLLHRGVTWKCGFKIDKVSRGVIMSHGRAYTFDMVFDCRGLGAKDDMPSLRGVRGEVLLLHSPQVSLLRPVRVVHPRYSIYVVPRYGNRFIVGASEIESCDFSRISVQSAMELLTAVYSLHRGFAEARIMDAMSNCRPAFPDNLPRVYADDGVIRVNGLYRFGYLTAPAIAEEVMLLLKSGKRGYSGLYAENG